MAFEETDTAADEALADEILAGGPAQAEPVVEQQSEPAPEPEPQAEQTAAKPDAQAGILRDLIDERVRRQELQRQIEAYKAKEKPSEEPDPFLNPQDFVQAQVRAQVDPVLRELRIAIAHNNKATATGVHGAELTDRACTEFDKALPTMHPAEAQRVLSSPNPFAAAVEWLRQRDMLAEIGSDPNAYRERILAEALNNPEFLGRANEAARLLAAGGSRPQTRPAASQPQSRASTAKPALPSLSRSGPGGSPPTGLHEPTDEELWDENMGTR